MHLVTFIVDKRGGAAMEAVPVHTYGTKRLSLLVVQAPEEEVAILGS